jgi:alanine-glyoxylate transaminase / serine-glyoxylate transaminase / serine-pyruvate transaminase
MLYGLRESLRMLREEGLDRVFARHCRLAEATRAAVRAWGLEIACDRPDEYSSVVTTVMMPEGHDSDRLRQIAGERFNLSLGAGLGRLKGRAFRIGHLGDFNELMLAGTLAGVELTLAAAGVPFRRGGVAAALDALSATEIAEETDAQRSNEATEKI